MFANVPGGMSVPGLPATVTVPGFTEWRSCRWLPLTLTTIHPSSFNRFSTSLTFTHRVCGSSRSRSVRVSPGCLYEIKRKPRIVLQGRRCRDRRLLSYRDLCRSNRCNRTIRVSRENGISSTPASDTPTGRRVRAGRRRSFAAPRRRAGSPSRPGGRNRPRARRR